MADKKQEYQYPHEIIDLPSGGKLYPDGNPLRDGKIDIKYMTAKEEDILTSQNLIKKGVVLDTLLDSLIITEGVNVNDLLIGDKNAIMIAARILAYGPQYTVSLTDPTTGEQIDHDFDLSECPFKELPDDVDYSKNEFEFELPTSKLKITFKLLNGRDEKMIESQLKSLKKLGGTSREITTRLKHQILSVNGEVDKVKLNSFVDNMLSRDSIALRSEMMKISPDINLKQFVDFDGEEREVIIPMEISFFWPASTI